MQIVKEDVAETVVDFTAAARRTARKIGEILRKRTMKPKETGMQQYQELLDMTEKTIQHAVQTQEQLKQRTEENSPAPETNAGGYISSTGGESGGSNQTPGSEKGEQVPAQEKVLSIFEPHTDIICQGEFSTPPR